MIYTWISWYYLASRRQRRLKDNFAAYLSHHLQLFGWSPCKYSICHLKHALKYPSFWSTIKPKTRNTRYRNVICDINTSVNAGQNVQTQLTIDKMRKLAKNTKLYNFLNQLNQLRQNINQDAYHLQHQHMSTDWAELFLGDKEHCCYCSHDQTINLCQYHEVCLYHEVDVWKREATPTDSRSLGTLLQLPTFIDHKKMLTWPTARRLHHMPGTLNAVLLFCSASIYQVSVAEWLARLTAVWEDPGSNHAADSCVYCDSCCDIWARIAHLFCSA